MAPPKPLVGALEKEAAALAKALEKRTAPITDAATRTLGENANAPWSDDALRVAIDEALSGKSDRIKEVTGTGVARVSPTIDLNSETGFGTSVVDQPGVIWPEQYGPYSHSTDTQPYIGPMDFNPVSDSRLAIAQDAKLTPATTEGGLTQAAYSNWLQNGQLRAGVDQWNWRPNQRVSEAGVADNSRVGKWPDAWMSAENIPKFLGTVGAGATAGALLAASPAQAQTDDWESAPVQDDWETAPAGGAVDDWEADVPKVNLRKPGQELVGGMSVGQPLPVQEFGGQTDADVGQFRPDMTDTPGPLRKFVDVVDRFEKTKIDPVIRLIQSELKREYMYGIARKPDEKSRAHGLGSALRSEAPNAAFAAENAGKAFIGETALNKPGSEHPAAVKAINDAEQRLGPEGAAFYQSMLQGMSNLPFYLIPGAGENAMVHGATGGALSAAADPEQGIIEGAVGGAIIGGTLKAGAEGVGALWRGAKNVVNKIRKPKMTPLAVVPPDQVKDLTMALAAMDVPVIPSKDAGKPLMVIRNVEDGKLVVDAITVKPDFKTGATDVPPGFEPLGVQTMLAKVRLGDTGISKLGKDVPVLDTPAVGEVVDRLRSVAPRPYEILDKAGKTESWLDRAISVNEWSEELIGDKPSDGLLLAWKEFADGSSGAKLYELADDQLLKDILRSRDLIKVKMATGKPQWGYRGGVAIFSPHPEELIPNALTADIGLDVGGSMYKGIEPRPNPLDVRGIAEPTEAELDNLVQRIRLSQAEGRIAAEQMALDQKAMELDVKLGGDGSGLALPEAPPIDPPPPATPNPAQPSPYVPEQIIPGVGKAPPPPPAPPSGGGGPPPGPHNFDPLEGLRIKAAPGFLNKLSRAVVPPTARGPIDQINAAIMGHGAEALERLRGDILTSLQKAAPEVQALKPWEQHRVLSSMSEWLDGRLNSEQLLEKHPELSQSLFKRLEAEKADIARNEERLRELGMLAPEGDMKKMLGIDPADDLPDYGVRMYWRHLLPAGEWAKMAKRDEIKMNSLIQAIEEDVYPTLDPITRRKRATRHLDFLLGDPERLAEARRDPTGAWKNVISEAEGSLKARKDLRWWEQAAFGQIDNAFIRIAESRTRQKQLILQGEMWRSVAENPLMSSAADNGVAQYEMGHDVQLPLNPAKFGKAAGRYVSAETFEALVQIPLAQRNASGYIGKMINAVKWGQTVGNLGSWVTNTLGNLQNLALSNTMNPWSGPLALGKYLKRFSGDFAAHMEAPGMRNTAAQARFMEALEAGLLTSDYASAEFKHSARQWNRRLEKEAAHFNGKINALDMFADMGKSFGRGVDKASQYYGAIDPAFKYVAYAAGIERGGINAETHMLSTVDGRKKAAKYLGKRWNPNWDDARVEREVKQETIRRVHLSFPMLDRVAPAVQKAGTLAGVVNPYLKIRMEQMRVYGHLPSRLTEPGMAANLLFKSAIAGTLYLGVRAMREANGISQEEVDQSFASAPDSIQRFKPGALALPWRDSKGRLMFADLSQTFEPMTYLAGDPRTAWATRMLKNLAISPIDNSVTEPGLVSILANGGMADPAFRERMVPEWQQGAAQAFADVMSRAGPGIFRNIYSTLERGGVGFEPKMSRVGPQEPQDPYVTAVNLALGPNRMFGAGKGQQQDANVMKAVQDLKKAEQELWLLTHSADGQSIGTMTLPLDKQKAIEKAEKILKEKGEKIRQIEKETGVRP